MAIPSFFRSRFKVISIFFLMTMLYSNPAVVEAESLQQVADKKGLTIGILLTQNNKAVIKKHADGVMFGISGRFLPSDQEVLSQQQLLIRFPDLGVIVTEGLAHDASLMTLSPDFDSPGAGE